MNDLRVGMTVRPTRVVVEQGPVAEFARVVGADDPVHRSVAAARAAGYGAPPVPPTYPFAMWHWGAHDDLQTGEPGDLSDLNELGERMRTDGGIMLHGEQEFDYERPLLVGETVEVRSVVAALDDKVTGTGRAMRTVTVRTEVRDLTDALVVTMISTILCVR